MSFPVIYILIMGPGAFTGTRDINKEQLVSALSQNWVNAEELAKYMQKFWVALEYSWSARVRQSNCVTLSLTSLGLSLWYYFSSNVQAAGISLICGIALWVMAARVNRPLAVFHNQAARFSNNSGIRDEWIMAAMSIVAFAELFPHAKKFSYMSNDVLSDEFARQAINIYRLNSL